VENLLISIRKSHAFSAGTFRSILPSRIIAPLLLKQIHARSYVRKKAVTSPRQVADAFCENGAELDGRAVDIFKDRHGKWIANR
jgi:hypothetical protein